MSFWAWFTWPTNVRVKGQTFFYTAPSSTTEPAPVLISAGPFFFFLFFMSKFMAASQSQWKKFDVWPLTILGQMNQAKNSINYENCIFKWRSLPIKWGSCVLAIECFDHKEKLPFSYEQCIIPSNTNTHTIWGGFGCESIVERFNLCSLGMKNHLYSSM